MSIRLSFHHTIYACMFAFVCQAVVNLFTPLLFLTFHQEFGISLAQIGWLVTVNFCTQLTVDLVCARLSAFIRYRPAILAAHACCSLGMLSLGILPDLLPSPYIGLCAATIVYSVGSGLLEVLASPIAEACPTEGKAAYMSLIHSFYCWGCVGVVVISTLLFHLLGLRHWRWVAALWAIAPALNFVYFCLVPMNQLVPDDDGHHGFRALLGKRVFWIAIVLMICAGAAEQAMEQWSSAFVEAALGLSKKFCDLVGPCLFAICMGSSRVVFARYSERLGLRRQMAVSAVIILAGYLLAALTILPVLGLLGCALCGLGVGVMWPGTLSLASRTLPQGGTMMFAFLALGGDIGCATGPTLVGCLAAANGDNLQRAFLAAAVFPVLILLGLANRFESKSN